MSIYNLISFLGIFCLMFVAWIFSKNRRNINWRVVFWTVALQLSFALFIFYIPVGLFLFNWINSAVVKILSFANEGIYFVFGPLAIPPGVTGPAGEKSIGFILAFQALPSLIFFSSLMALLYYVGILQKIVKAFAYVFTHLMRISGAESLCTSSNIVVGIESTLTIRPYIGEMTHSELCTILTAGMATIASTIMAIYVGFLYHEFPAIAGHLVSASILSAPAAIVMSKLLYPEDQHPITLGKEADVHYEKASSWVETIIKGSQEGVKMLVGIVALLLALLGLLAMVNWAIAGLGQKIGLLLNVSLDLSLQKILSFIYYPFSFLMGVPWQDIPKVSILLGERTIVTELVSYQHLAQYIRDGQIVDPRSVVVVSYALCGFSHIASLAIFVGGISALAPNRAKDLSALGFRALFAATLACLMTGAVAGIFTTAGQVTILNSLPH
ncbi:TPA: nucleoside transporter [bacterium]|nr:nucleoside transporter [bacterium]